MVHGPPVKSITRAPTLGKLDSSNATAAESATPVQRDGRCAGSSGHGSIRSSEMTELIANSASATGSRKRDDAERASGAACPLPRPRPPAPPAPASPSSSFSRFGSRSFLPLTESATTERAQAGQ
jgi:hypothetical protein